MPCCAAPMSYSMFITCALLEQINDDDADDISPSETSLGLRVCANMTLH